MPIKRSTRAATLPKSPDLEALLTGVNPQRSCEYTRFVQILRAYNARHPDQAQGLSGVRMYIYRGFPKINLKLIGQQTSNIETIECVTEESGAVTVIELPHEIREYIISKHGGGKYRVSLNDKAKASEGGSTQIAQCAFNIDEIEHPPVLDPRSLVMSDPATAQWVSRQITLGIFTRDDAGNVILATEKQTPKSAEQMALEMASRAQTPVQETHADRKAVDVLAELANRNATADPMGQMMKMWELLKPNDSGTNMTAILSAITTMFQSNAQMQMEMFKLQLAQAQQQAARPAPSTDPAEMMERFFEMAQKFAPAKSDGGWMETIRQLAPTILPMLMMRSGATPAQIEAARAVIPTAPQTGFDTGAGSVPGPLTAAQLHEVAMRANQCLARGHDGSQFAEALEVIFSPDVYTRLYAMGRQGFSDTLTHDPQVGNAIASHPKFPAFLDEFFEYGGGPAEPPAANAPNGAAGARV